MSGAQTTDGILAIPVIDISPFTSAEGTTAERAAVAAQWDAAASEVGFVQVVGHGIPDQLVDGLTTAMDSLFELPAAVKQDLAPPSPDVNRGYSGPKSERLSYSLGITSAKALFEAFNVGVPASAFPGLDLPEGHYPENLWPDLPAFRSGVEGWFTAVGAVARHLTTIFALALGLPEDHFQALTDHSIDVLRMNNYRMPADDVRLETGQLGMGAHTDYGIVTVLWADAITPGLQVLDTAGGWHDVTPVPGALLVNLGDAVARWTNDRWISTMHRVLAPIGADGRPVHRRSAAYFHDGNAEAVIACLPGCSVDRAPSYSPVTVADHLAAKLGASRGGELNTSADREASRLRTGVPG